MEIYNFNAGPSMLPREVVEQTAAAVLDYNGMGGQERELKECEIMFGGTLLQGNKELI